ncbi:MAG: PorT family protein, partial [Bacteroidetes bacterium]
LKAASFLLLQLEMNYEENGFNFKNNHDLTGVGYTGNYKTKYISIPLTTIFEIGKNIKYYGYVGINLRLLVKADNYTSVSSTSEPVALHTYDLSYDPTFLFNKSEFGGLVGLGIKIPLCEKVRLLIDSRYNFGITKAAKNTEFDYNASHWTTDTPDNFQKVHNRSLVLSLGISYCLKSQNKNRITKPPNIQSTKTKPTLECL